jgi:hypothetical protein
MREEKSKIGKKGNKAWIDGSIVKKRRIYISSTNQMFYNMYGWIRYLPPLLLL